MVLLGWVPGKQLRRRRRRHQRPLLFVGPFTKAASKARRHNGLFCFFFAKLVDKEPELVGPQRSKRGHVGPVQTRTKHRVPDPAPGDKHLMRGRRGRHRSGGACLPLRFGLFFQRVLKHATAEQSHPRVHRPKVAGLLAKVRHFLWRGDGCQRGGTHDDAELVHGVRHHAHDGQIAHGVVFQALHKPHPGNPRSRRDRASRLHLQESPNSLRPQKRERLNQNVETLPFQHISPTAVGTKKRRSREEEAAGIGAAAAAAAAAYVGVAEACWRLRLQKPS
mmetsp:Transcript_7318/g.13692  ORF Transcript_7318/g.13692 Transcript_7318/m.13692 type:complete len:278 (+) Transcript_7318:1272-2105(+)